MVKLKLISLLLISLCFELTLSAQIYTVARIKGQITNQTNQKLLKKGSDYRKSDQLRFSEASNRIAAFDKQGQLYIVYPPKAKNRSLSPIYYQIQARVKGRDGLITNEISLINHIGEDSIYLIAGDSTKITISPTAFSMNKDTFFYIRYEYEGEIINKQLSHEGKALKIDKSTLFEAKFDSNEKYGVDTVIQINPLMVDTFEFGYYDLKNNRPIHIRDRRLADDLQMRVRIPIRLKFIESNILQEELEFAIPIMKDNIPPIQRDSLLFSQIHQYSEETFNGELKKANLKEWLNTYIPDWK